MSLSGLLSLTSDCLTGMYNAASKVGSVASWAALAAEGLFLGRCIKWFTMPLPPGCALRPDQAALVDEIPQKDLAAMCVQSRSIDNVGSLTSADQGAVDGNDAVYVKLSAEERAALKEQVSNFFSDNEAECELERGQIVTPEATDAGALGAPLVAGDGFMIASPEDVSALKESGPNLFYNVELVCEQEYEQTVISDALDMSEQGGPLASVYNGVTFVDARGVAEPPETGYGSDVQRSLRGSVSREFQDLLLCVDEGEVHADDGKIFMQLTEAQLDALPLPAYLTYNVETELGFLPPAPNAI